MILLRWSTILQLWLHKTKQNPNESFLDGKVIIFSIKSEKSIYKIKTKTSFEKKKLKLVLNNYVFKGFFGVLFYFSWFMNMCSKLERFHNNFLAFNNFLIRLMCRLSFIKMSYWFMKCLSNALWKFMLHGNSTS